MCLPTPSFEEREVPNLPGEFTVSPYVRRMHIDGSGQTASDSRSLDQGQRARRWRIAATVLGGIALTALVARDRAATVPVAPAAPATHPVATQVMDDPFAEEQFTRFALNALLAPLLDDDVPARWTDVGVNHFCGPATRVEVDGKPLVPGLRVPATSFTVRWHMDQCWPLGFAAGELSGVVELLVFHDDAGLSAVVRTDHLQISGMPAPHRLQAPFTASLSLAALENGR